MCIFLNDIHGQFYIGYTVYVKTLKAFIQLFIDEVINVCGNNNFIEQQAYEFTEKIRENSLYKFVRIDFSESTFGGNTKIRDDQLVLITKVILEDKDGTVYFVEPNSNGLRFAKKEITYDEYKKLQKIDDRKAYTMFFGIIGLFGVLMVTTINYFT